MFKLVVLFSVIALAAAKPGWLTPITYQVPAVSSQYSSVVHGSPVVPTVYSGYSPIVSGVVPGVALSQAPNSPAVVLDAVNGVPLDTPEVVAARVAHYQAKALAGVHTIAKRSVVAPLTYSSVISPLTSVASLTPVASVAPVSPLIRSAVSPLTYSSPFVTYGSPNYVYPSVVPKALSVHPW